MWETNEIAKNETALKMRRDKKIEGKFQTRWGAKNMSMFLYILNMDCVLRNSFELPVAKIILILFHNPTIFPISISNQNPRTFIRHCLVVIN